MAHGTKLGMILGAVALAVLSAPGCGGTDTNSSSGGGGAGTGGAGASGGTTMMGGTGGTTMTTTPTGGTGGMTTTTTDPGTTDLGAQATEFVNAGGTAKSANYKMVFTLGQGTVNQNRTKSATYALQGGIIGATGSFK